jgi:YihY family inner membrane protein
MMLVREPAAARRLLLVSAINVVEARWFEVILTRTDCCLQGWAIKSASTIIFIVLVGLIFYFVPNAAVRFRDVWVGAILTGLLWRAALAAFSRYVRDLHRFSVHGSIAAVVVFLVWVYISAVILLYGVEVTAAYAARRRRLKRSPPHRHQNHALRRFCPGSARFHWVLRVVLHVRGAERTS